jgi:DNA-binding CsgD family transcriptional regulator
MKKSGFFPLARLAASLSLFGILLCIHLSFTLAHFLPSESKGVMNAVYAFFFTGAVLGAVLCPLFLPVPNGKNKPLLMGLCFIALLTAVEFILRALGVRVWLGSMTVRSVMAIPEGMLTTMCYGLFYLTWLQRPHPTEASDQNRTGRFCSMVLGAALLGSVLARYYSVPFMEAGIAAQDPFKGVEFVFGFIKWCMLISGAFSGLCVFMTHNASADEDVSAVPGIKTDWSMIIRLISLASVFTILNGLLGMQMLPLYSNEAIYYPHYLTVAAAVFILRFLAGRSTGRFIRWFTLPAVVLFILVSCLPLFEQHPQFNVIMSTLVAVAHYTVWVVFTTAVVEYYAGGFWFYGMATVIFFSVVFAFLAPAISPLVPDGTEYRVLFIAIAAVSFMLLAFRLIFPKQPQEGQPSKIPAKKRQEPFPETSTLEDIFKEHGLSQREIEVAALLVKEGLRKKEIGERLYISAGTAKIHISKIYQKFNVSNRAEFMALFVNRDQ